MSHRGIVLVATASANLGQLVARELLRHGWKSHHEADGAAVEDSLQAVSYAAVVMDAHLPGCAGPSLVHDLRARGIATPCVLLLDSETCSLNAVAARLGRTRCLIGPDLSRLIPVLNAALGAQVV